MSIFSRMMISGMVAGAITGILAVLSLENPRALGGLGFYVMFNLWQIGASIASEISKAIRERNALPK